ncbi:MAG TPA: hypothetical protein VH092_12735 [Urbifossiella sp.]|jgi:hypothetical protein|nr:hypothetical protein [Urbifossiella sp.]
MSKQFRLPVLAAVVAAGFATPAHAQAVRFQVFDRNDKQVYTVYPTAVEAPDGKVALRYDANNKLIETADGAGLYRIEGDATSGYRVYNPKDRDVRLAHCDGKFVRRVDTNGKVFFYYDPTENCIRPNTGERKTHTLHRLQVGTHTLAVWQVVALAHLLSPDGFALDAAAAKAQRDEAAMTGKAEEARIKSRLFGEFTILNSTAKEFQKGKAKATQVGRYHHMTYDLAGGQKLQGIGLYMPSAHQDEEEIFTALSADGKVGLAVYEITDGGLDGTWYPAAALADPAAALGTEVLTGKTGRDFNGAFTITAAKTPGKGEAYTGALTLLPVKRTDSEKIQSFNMTWTLGSTKVYGAGIMVEHFCKDAQRRKYLVAAAGGGEVMVGRHISRNPSTVELEFFALGRTIAGGENSGVIRLLK